MPTYSPHKPISLDGTGSINIGVESPSTQTSEVPDTHVTANLKDTQVAQQVSLFQSLVQQISARSSLQSLMQQYNTGNHSQELYESIKVKIVPASSLQ